MSIVFQCPRCQAEIQVPDTTAGKKGRCPKCQGKVRIPDLTPPEPPPEVPARPFRFQQVKFVDESRPSAPAPSQPPAARGGSPPAPAPPPDLGALIEFPCPNCAVAIRVPPQAAGQRGRCQQCGTRVLVPAVSQPLPEFPSWENVAVAEPHTEPPADDGVFPVEDDEPDDAEALPASARATKRRGPAMPGGLLGPALVVVAVACLAGVAYWLSAPKLSGVLVAERVDESELPQGFVGKDLFDDSDDSLANVLVKLEKEPLRMNSSLVGLEMRGGKKGLAVVVAPGPNADVLRVDPGGDKALADFLGKQEAKYDQFRLKSLAEAASRLLVELGKKGPVKGETPIEGLAEYRNTVGLSATVRGVGYFVQAVHNHELYHCVAEDEAGRLYFLLPHGTRHFELRGRTLPQTQLTFAGKYQVEVSQRRHAAKSSKRKKSANADDSADEPKQSKPKPVPKTDEDDGMDGDAMPEGDEPPPPTSKPKKTKKKTVPDE